MAELSELLLRVHEDVEKPMKVSSEYRQAKVWAEKGQEIAEKYIQGASIAGRQIPACDEACAAASLCLGAFYEVRVFMTLENDAKIHKCSALAITGAPRLLMSAF